MKARIAYPEPPPDNRTPEEKAAASRRAKKLLAALMGFHAAVDTGYTRPLKQEQENSNG